MSASTARPDESGSSPAVRDESKEYRKALTLIKAGQLEKAREVLESYIQQNPESVKGMNKYAFVLLELGKGRAAKQMLQHIVARGQRDSYTHFLLGTAFHRERNFKVAIQQYRHALALNPDDIYTINRLADAMRQAGEGAGAVALLAKGLTLSREDPTTFVLLSELYVEQGDPVSARKWADQGLETHPNELRLRCLQGECLARTGDLAAARTAFEQTAKDFPASAEGRLGLARTLEKMGRIPDALRELASAASTDPKNTAVLREQARLLGVRGDADAALTALERALDLSPSDPVVMAELAEALIRKRLKLKGYMMLKRSIALRNDVPLSHYLVGRLFLEEELFVQAADELRFACKLDACHRPARGALAEAVLRAGDAGEALELAAGVLGEDAGDRQALFVKALVDRERGGGRRAEEALAGLARDEDRVGLMARAALAAAKA